MGCCLFATFLVGTSTFFARTSTPCATAIAALVWSVVSDVFRLPAPVYQRFQFLLVLFLDVRAQWFCFQESFCFFGFATYRAASTPS